MKKNIYIYNEGQLERKDNTIRFTTYDKKTDIPVETISDIYIMTDMTITTSLLNLAAKYGILIHFFNYYNFYTGTFCPRETLIAGQVVVEQVKAYLDPEHRLKLAKQFVTGAGENIYRNLRYYNNRGKDVSQAMDDIRYFIEQAQFANNVPELMGFEGNIHERYYRAFPQIINQKIEFERRVKHPPDTAINSLISFVNSMIYTRVLSEIYKTQLNPTISFLHQPGVKRFSLALDIAEIFKPLIGDRLMLSLLNKKQITESDFTKEIDYIHLKKEASRLIASELDQRLRTTIRHKTLNRDVSYEYLMRLECYKILKDITGEKNYEPFVIWW